MKTIIALALAFAGMTANAFDFSLDTSGSCGTYCSGYVTDDPAYTVDYVNDQYSGSPNRFRETISINGKVYSGYATGPDGGGVLFNSTFDSVTQTFTSDGTYVTLSNLSYAYRHTCTHSGRGQHCTSWYWITGGTVTVQ